MTSQYTDLCIKVSSDRLPELHRLISTQLRADEYVIDEALSPVSSRTGATALAESPWFSELKTQLVIQSDFIRCLLDMNTDAVLMCSEDFSIESCNQSALDLFQMEQHELIGRDYLGFFADAKDGERFEQFLKPHALIPSDKVKYNRVFRIRNGVGRILHVEIWMEHHFQLHGLSRVIMMKDCSQRMRTELELRTNIAIHRTIAEAASDAIVSIDQYGIIQYCNPALLRLFQIPRPEVIDFTIEKILPGFKGNLQKILVGLNAEKEIEIRDIECMALAANGQTFNVAVSVGGISADFPFGLSIIIRDISSRKKTELALQEAKKAAEAASQAKSLFLANMSHEIRTPLNAIVGFMELIMEQLDDKPQGLQYAETIRRNSRLLLQIINDILDLSKVEAGRLEFTCGVCSLNKIIDNVRSLFSPRAEANGVKFHVVKEGPIPDLIETDEIRLEQVLINLVGNAVKFTSSGLVELKISSEKKAAEPTLIFTITDTGRGISPEAQASLFQPFSQGDIARTRVYGGTGLGLLLSRKLAEGLGGSLQLVSSQVNQGSCFRFAIQHRLPVLHQIPKERKAAAPRQVLPFDRASRPLRGIRFLVVDDAPDNHALLSHLIRGYGGDVAIAENGVQAVDKVVAEPYDFIFMDLQMPEMDGFQATEKIRGLGYKGFIFAFSAANMKEDRSRSLEVGCDMHLAKPIEVNLVLRQIHDRLPLLKSRVLDLKPGAVPS
ncbi:MAG TPA: ATP-binding protein [Oligoflexus sp.]|uniref:ATP-binding protein n=1 Tax=Oligoflexus sp. TaxID=1971216 RepID=UPI002D7E9D87|nr:ATP-binding protein [Oligoflexus sp.]HET9236179.1 ATP-binding protein [Oligoflexus sp.]